MLPVKCKIGPSILNADLSDLTHESQKLINSGADYLHLDVMDGHFVPNITFGHPLVKCLRRKIKETFFEAHMMVSKPDDWIEGMGDAGVDQYTFHVEASEDVPGTCRKIRDAGMKLPSNDPPSIKGFEMHISLIASKEVRSLKDYFGLKVGIGIKPNTDVTVIEEYIELADMILIMTVEPGFGGQKFMSSMLGKVKYLRENYPGLDIEVDGGVGLSTIDQCAQAGANMIVSGSAITSSDNPEKVISELRSSVNSVLLASS